MKTNINIALLIVAGLITAGFLAESEESISNDSHNFNYADRIEWSATTVQGELSGFDCAVVGEYCPTTHRGADYTTGVFNKEGKTFYFVVNIPQSFLQQYFREKVEVEDTSYDPYNHAVEPETIHVIEEDERRLVYESGYFIDENNNRATFQDGVFKNGRWIVPE